MEDTQLDQQPVTLMTPHRIEDVDLIVRDAHEVPATEHPLVFSNLCQEALLQLSELPADTPIPKKIPIYRVILNYIKDQQEMVQLENDRFLASRRFNRLENWFDISNPNLTQEIVMVMPILKHDMFNAFAALSGNLELLFVFLDESDEIGVQIQKFDDFVIQGLQRMTIFGKILRLGYSDQYPDYSISLEDLYQYAGIDKDIVIGSENGSIKFHNISEAQSVSTLLINAREAGAKKVQVQMLEENGMRWYQVWDDLGNISWDDITTMVDDDEVHFPADVVKHYITGVLRGNVYDDSVGYIQIPGKGGARLAAYYAGVRDAVYNGAKVKDLLKNRSLYTDPTSFLIDANALLTLKDNVEVTLGGGETFTGKSVELGFPIPQTSE